MDIKKTLITQVADIRTSDIGTRVKIECKVNLYRNYKCKNSSVIAEVMLEKESESVTGIMFPHTYSFYSQYLLNYPGEDLLVDGYVICENEKNIVLIESFWCAKDADTIVF